MRGPALTAGRHSDQRSPLAQEAIVPDALSVQDLGYESRSRMAERRRARAFSLTRGPCGSAIYDRQGQQLSLRQLAPKQVGQTLDLEVAGGGTRAAADAEAFAAGSQSRRLPAARAAGR
jgi:hypothetical protein